MNKHLNLSSIYAIASIMSALDSPSMEHNKCSNPNLEYAPPKKMIPKGCEEYQFQADGKLTIYEDMTYFRCIALNEKNARKKFKKQLNL
jgi:hypothetical protein